jgi:eukaryotic-like serine/threonine-protein kinase
VKPPRPAYREPTPGSVLGPSAQGELPALLPGETLRLGSCELCFELASGGMATVYLGVHRGAEGFEKLVAVKRPLPRLCKDPDYVDMLADEASVSSDVNHPCIRNVFDLGVAADGSPYLVMEFLVGEPLSTVAQAMAEQPQLVRTTRHHRIVSRIIAGCCQGMHAVHELTNRRVPRNVVHRDLTPDNLFALHDGTVRVTDFGIMRARARRQRETAQTVLKGKVAYMSPEYLGCKPYDRRSDVWALGVVLWELLTGSRLFRRQGEADTLSAVASAPIPRPSTLCSNVDRRLDDIIGKALARNVNQRYQTAHDMAQDLEAYLAHCGGAGAPDVGAWLRQLLPDSLPNLTALVEATHELTARPSPSALGRVQLIAEPQRGRPPPVLSLSPNASLTPTKGPRRERPTPVGTGTLKGRYSYFGRE